MSAAFIVPDWPAPAHVRALSTTRDGGVSTGPYASLNLGAHVGDAPAAVQENRRRLRERAGLPAEPAWLAQVHGVAVRDLDAGPGTGAGPGRGAGAATGTGAATGAAPADAAITRQPGRICAILTADCLPVLFTDVQGTRVGAAHAGWRGLAAGVLEATVAALAVAPDALIAWLGPAIGPSHFEVGPEVREAFIAADPGADAAFAPNARGRYQADLYALARRRLAALGVLTVAGGGLCTVGDSTRFFSHRRDGTTGRQATLIWLEDGGPDQGRSPG